MEESKEERRPTDIDQPNAKRRAEGKQRTKDDFENDDDNEVRSAF